MNQQDLKRSEDQSFNDADQMIRNELEKYITDL